MIKKPYPSETQDRFIVRLPDGMRDRIAELAKSNNRSMNAEIVQRLEWALPVLSAPTVAPYIPDVPGEIPFMIRQEIAQMAITANVPFEEMVKRVFLAGINKDAPQVLYIPIMPGATIKEFLMALDAAKDVVRPDATIVSEMVSKTKATG
jgi:hypothetical protein